MSESLDSDVERILGHPQAVGILGVLSATLGVIFAATAGGNELRVFLAGFAFGVGVLAILTEVYVL